MRLKELLIEKHINGSELARRLGVTPSYVNAVVAGRTNLSVKRCEDIAKILNVPLAALFEGYLKPGYVLCPHCGKPVALKKD